MSDYRIEVLERRHAIEGFDCGVEPLNRFLTRHALQNQQANASRTYVGLAGSEVVGYYSLAVGEVRHEDATERLVKGLARHPVPIMLLACLAVSRDWQGKGIGVGLLKDALGRAVQASGIAGVRAVVVHAKDDDARAFYERFGFAPSATDPLHLYLLVNDVWGAIHRQVKA